MRESVFFKRKMKEAGAGLMRKNVQSVQIPALCKGKAAKSRFAQAPCLISLGLATALLRPDFVFRNNTAPLPLEKLLSTGRRGRQLGSCC